MRQLVTHVWCDQHHTDSSDLVKASITRTLSIDGGAPGEVDLCEACDAAVFGPLAELMRAAHEPESRSAPRRPLTTRTVIHKEFECDLCDVEYANRGGLILHVWRDHVRSDKPAMPKKCPECHLSFPAPTAMGAHRAAKHGWDALFEAYKAVQKA